VNAAPKPPRKGLLFYFHKRELECQTLGLKWPAEQRLCDPKERGPWSDTTA